MSIQNLLQYHISEINRLADEHGAYNLRLFGSVARNEDKEESDVDILVKMKADKSLLDRIAFMHALEDLLGRKVDVVNEEALHKSIRDQVLSESISI